MIILYLIFLGLALYGVIKNIAPEMTKPTPVGPIKDGLEGKLENLLLEKNRAIDLLQKELKAFKGQKEDFEKLRALLEEEIYRLREQNRILRSELGLPTLPQTEKSCNSSAFGSVSMSVKRL
ncbi:MAG: hypothetical protein HQL13_01500 [Candidatus Omnitrophica bacterium]|nr:hypothetical protein [Candidatus Omnitrophota bacterium]